MSDRTESDWNNVDIARITFRCNPIEASKFGFSSSCVKIDSFCFLFFEITIVDRERPEERNLSVRSPCVFSVFASRLFRVPRFSGTDQLINVYAASSRRDRGKPRIFSLRAPHRERRVIIVDHVHTETETAIDYARVTFGCSGLTNASVFHSRVARRASHGRVRAIKGSGDLATAAGGVEQNNQSK